MQPRTSRSRRRASVARPARLNVAIEKGRPDDDYYEAKVKVLGEQIEHHVEEEEARMEGIFAQARKAGLDMEQLGQELASRKADLVAQYEADWIPKPELTTMEATPA